MEEIIGYLASIVYNNPSNSYSVIKLKLDQKKDEKVTVVGYFKIPKKDELIKFYGEYIDNKKYGMQFQVDSYEKVLPNSKTSIVRYLSSSLFHGVGEKLANKIVDSLGTDCLNLINEDPSVLDNLDIKDSLKEIIISGVKQNKDFNEAIKLFVGHGISMKFLIKMDAVYGKDLVKNVSKNPYILVEDIDGLGFKTVDKMALEIGIKEDDPKRIKSLIIYELKQIAYKTLDTYTDKEILFKECKKELKTLNINIFNNLYDELKMSQDIIEDTLGRVFYYDLYDSEKGIAKLLKPYINSNSRSYSSKAIDKAIDNIQDIEGIIYSDEQRKTIHNVLNNNVSIITGGPGTGKTTVVNAIIKIYKSFNENAIINLVAPTGRASKRMSELSNYPSCTIHRLLKWDLETNSFVMNELNPVFGNFLVVDEFSMVDSLLFYNLLKATHPFAKLLFIGDDKQLEPLCPGNVLKDLIDSKLISVNNLTINHRQSINSGIIPLCFDINEGILNQENFNKDDVLFINETSSNIRQRILDIVKEEINNGASQNQIQILSPMYDGNGGITSINHLIREYFNPKTETSKEFKIGSVIYRIGDKILQLKNQPNDNVFNGDIGVLEEIENEDDETYLIINFDGIKVKYSKNEYQNFTHAYAISVHKSQGSEFDIVIMPFLKEHFIMLKRKLIYTACSRAKKKLILIGDINCFIRGINTIDKKIRKTTLKERIINSFKDELN